MTLILSERVGNDFNFAWDDLAGKIVFKRAERVKGRLHAEVWLESTVEGRVGPVIYSGVSLDSAIERLKFARSMAKKWPVFGDDSDEQWDDRLLQAAIKAKELFGQSSPTIVLKDAPKRPDATPWLVERFLLLNETNTIYADGESGKSLLCLVIALCVCTGKEIAGFKATATGPALYLDWETTAEEHRERMEALCRSLEIDQPDNLHYRFMERPLVEDVSDIKAEVERLKAVLTIADSIVYGLHGPAKDDEIAREYMNTLRAFPCTRLATTHVTKDAAQTKDHASAFGSAFFRNGARSSWEMWKTFEEGTRIEATLIHKKVNNRGKQKSFGLQFAFDEEAGSIGVSRIKADILALSSATDVERVRAALSRGKLTGEGIAEKTGLAANAIRSAIHRMPDVQRLNPEQQGARAKAMYGLSNPEHTNVTPIQQTKPRLPYADQDNSDAVVFS